MSMMLKAKTPDDLVKQLSPGLKTLMERLRKFVKSRAPQLEEKVKWGGICWVGRGVVCYAHPLEDRVDYGFFKGVLLKDPKKILEGDGKFLRHVKVCKPADIKERTFAGLLAEAQALDK